MFRNPASAGFLFTAMIDFIVCFIYIILTSHGIIYMNALPFSRKDALAIGSRWYFTGKPCKHGHIDVRFTCIGKCKTCARLEAAAGHVPTTARRRAYNDLASFKAVATELHSGCYTYEHAVYVDAHTPLAVTCAEHGDFVMSPTNHMQGKACRRCAGAASTVRQTKPSSQFIADARHVWGDAFDYTDILYKGSHTPVRITCVTHRHTFLQTPTNHLSAKQACPKCNHMRSSGESAVATFLATFTKVIQRDRTVITPKELDIYLPDHKLAIEYCGEYWHSYGDAESEAAGCMKHYEKYKACQAAGIRLITLYETEWLDKQQQIKRLLRNAIGKLRGRVMARKCELRLVEPSGASAFYDTYHPQGGAGYGVHYGLYHKGALVACMRFTHGINDRGNNTKRDWTLSRYATRVQVSGGASRLLKAFVRERKPKSVKSFSDNRFFNGGMYAVLGFELEADIVADYQVWHSRLGLKHKAYWQRRELHGVGVKLGIDVAFDHETDPRTERDITYLLGGRRLFDCGKKRWRLAV